MNIGIDISQMAYEGTGVARYVKGLTKALLEAKSPHKFVLFAGALRKRSFFEELKKTSPYDQADIKIFPFPPKLARHLQNLPMPFDQLLGKLDLFHTSDWAEPMTSCPKVTTIHDLVFHKFPETVDPLVLASQTTRLIRVVKSGTHIIADSQNTKNDLKEIYHLKDEQIDVVYPGIDPIFVPAKITEVERVKTKYNFPPRYLLSVGTQEPRKNLDRVIEAFKILRADPAWVDVALVLTGQYGWGSKVAPVPGMIATGFVEEQDLPALYTGAEVFVYPSLYEGFGFPVLEAMACGTPVVTSNISSLPEIVGTAEVRVDPHYATQIATGIQTASENRDTIRIVGLEQASQFSWARAAEQIISIYEKIGNK